VDAEEVGRRGEMRCGDSLKEPHYFPAG
jgi:hypothetical protein